MEVVSENVERFKTDLNLEDYFSAVISEVCLNFLEQRKEGLCKRSDDICRDVASVDPGSGLTDSRQRQHRPTKWRSAVSLNCFLIRSDRSLAGRCEESDVEEVMIPVRRLSMQDYSTLVAIEEAHGLDDDASSYRYCGGVPLAERRVRTKRKWKVEKADKQIKTKHCLTIKNNKSRKDLHINHRIFKLINLPMRSYNFLPGPKPRSIIDGIQNLLRNGTIHNEPIMLPHTLMDTNLPEDMDRALAAQLIAMQDRDLTPEDYEMLLRLDELVAPKTVTLSDLNRLPIFTSDKSNVGSVCAICQEPCEIGQRLRALPCKHFYHLVCIDAWLSTSSVNCPLDGLEVLL